MCPLCRQQFALHPVSPPRHPEAAGVPALAARFQFASQPDVGVKDPQSGQPVVQADRLVLQTQGSQITMNVSTMFSCAILTVTDRFNAHVLNVALH